MRSREPNIWSASGLLNRETPSGRAPARAGALVRRLGFLSLNSKNRTPPPHTELNSTPPPFHSGPAVGSYQPSAAGTSNNRGQQSLRPHGPAQPVPAYESQPHITYTHVTSQRRWTMVYGCSRDPLPYTRARCWRARLSPRNTTLCTCRSLRLRLGRSHTPQMPVVAVQLGSPLRTISLKFLNSGSAHSSR